MIFAHNNYGITDKLFLNHPHIAYLRLGKAKISSGYTIGDTTAISNNKQVAFLKAYNEYLERFSMGIPTYKRITKNASPLIDDNPTSIAFADFGYGNGICGHNDTTGTASGKHSSFIIKKALLELIEKNDCFCLWYGRCGYEIKIDSILYEQINHLHFISDTFRIFLVNEISNYFTAIIFGFKDGNLICSGASCDADPHTSIVSAIYEAKTIEWQQYNNKSAFFYKINKTDSDKINNHLNQFKSICLHDQFSKKVPEINLSDWINNIYFSVLYSDSNGIKTIKCISPDLLSCIPLIDNIHLSLDKTIVKKYYRYTDLDCPIA